MIPAIAATVPVAAAATPRAPVANSSAGAIASASDAPTTIVMSRPGTRAKACRRCTPSIGLAPAQVLAVLGALDGPRLAGVCVSEFDPGRDHADRSLAMLVWLVEHLLLRKFE